MADTTLGNHCLAKRGNSFEKTRDFISEVFVRIPLTYFGVDPINTSSVSKMSLAAEDGDDIDEVADAGEEGKEGEDGEEGEEEDEDAGQDGVVADEVIPPAPSLPAVLMQPQNRSVGRQLAFFMLLMLLIPIAVYFISHDWLLDGTHIAV